MELSTGLYYCSNDIWGNKGYNANHILTINKYPEEDANAVYYHRYDDDFKAVAKEVIIEYEDTILKDFLLKKFGMVCKDDCMQECIHHTLKDEVVAWLNENVAPSTDRNRKDTPQGWSMRQIVGKNHDIDLNIFFLRRQDALNFVRKFSRYDKFTKTYNQETYVQKVLNVKTNRYEIVEHD